MSICIHCDLQVVILYFNNTDYKLSGMDYITAMRKEGLGKIVTVRIAQAEMSIE